MLPNHVMFKENGDIREQTTMVTMQPEMCICEQLCGECEKEPLKSWSSIEVIFISLVMGAIIS